MNNFELEKYARRMKIRYFRGVFMRDKLPSTNCSRKNESAIVNLDSHRGKGTHWVAYMKIGNVAHYYDSFAAPPPIEIERYMKNCTIIYNYEQDQRIDQVICGHLCLKFLVEMSNATINM